MQSDRHWQAEAVPIGEARADAAAMRELSVALTSSTQSPDHKDDIQVRWQQRCQQVESPRTVGASTNSADATAFMEPTISLKFRSSSGLFEAGVIASLTGRVTALTATRAATLVTTDNHTTLRGHPAPEVSVPLRDGIAAAHTVA